MAATASDAAKALAATRARQTVVCVICGHEWQGLVRPNQPARTCSPKCRQQLYRNTRRAALVDRR